MIGDNQGQHHDFVCTGNRRADDLARPEDSLWNYEQVSEKW